jgi:hypothetical protein
VLRNGRKTVHPVQRLQHKSNVKVCLLSVLVIRWELFFRIIVVFGCHVSPYTSGPQMSSKSLFQEDVTSRTVAQRTEVQIIRAAEEFRRKRTDRYDGMWYLSGIYYSM